ncbi:hypothetical protein PHMEG_00029819 [Phytophthora megakarya]|uniref:PiggyBac transposable element-derived protein domain-containing protein n=1 Tax=Phytophthora megakarya TaxID=4795 RepID=A0A225V2M9_9STRA|nr:hypothetical protein PHMEG_00029819 [Phytophthora megakarya]
MSICPLSDIAEYWSTCVQGNHGENKISEYQIGIAVSRPRGPTLDKLRDPLWHSRAILNHFQKQFAAIAVPTGVSTIGKMTVATKARSRARTYMPSKPDKYGIRFYAVVSWEALYVHSLWDNASGNALQSSPALRYSEQFPALRTSLYNTLRRNYIGVNPIRRRLCG